MLDFLIKAIEFIHALHTEFAENMTHFIIQGAKLFINIAKAQFLVADKILVINALFID